MTQNNSNAVFDQFANSNNESTAGTLENNLTLEMLEDLARIAEHNNLEAEKVKAYCEQKVKEFTEQGLLVDELVPHMTEGLLMQMSAKGFSSFFRSLKAKINQRIQKEVITKKKIITSDQDFDQVSQKMPKILPQKQQNSQQQFPLQFESKNLTGAALRQRFMQIHREIAKIDKITSEQYDVSKASGQQQIGSQNEIHRADESCQSSDNEMVEKDASSSDSDWSKKRQKPRALMTKRKPIQKTNKTISGSFNASQDATQLKQKASANPWTEDDYLRLLEGVKVYGKQYKQLSDFMADRSDQAIRIKMQKILRDYQSGIDLNNVQRQIAENATEKTSKAK